MDLREKSNINLGDDIDFFDVLESLWSERKLIVVLAILVFILGTLYILQRPQKWTAEVQISPLDEVELRFLNPPVLVGTNLEADLNIREIISDLTPEKALIKFTEEFRSVQAFIEFLTLTDLKLFGPKSGQINTTLFAERISGFLESQIEIVPSSEIWPFTAIKLTYDHPETAAILLNEYVSFINERLVRKRQVELRFELENTIEKLEFELLREKETYIAEMRKQLTDLTNTLDIAKINPSIAKRSQAPGLTVEPDTGRLTVIPAHSLAIPILEAEISSIKSRLEGPIGGARFSRLQVMKELLQNFQIKTGTNNIIQVEKFASAPAIPDGPSRTRYFAILLVTGFCIGALGVWIKIALAARRFRRSGL